MNANTKSRGWRAALSVLAVSIVGAMPAGALAGTAAPQQPVKKQAKKTYYIFTTGSQIPVPYDRVSGHVATTAAHEQVIRITDRNRLQAPEIWYSLRRF